jgi:hypothetical protein
VLDHALIQLPRSVKHFIPRPVTIPYFGYLNCMIGRDASMMSYLGRLWRGDVGLACTYWVWGVLVVGIGIGAGGIFVAGLSGIPALAILWFVVYPASLIFMAVAVWRSSSKYAGPRVWVWLARFIIITAPFRLLASLGSLGTH